MPPDTVGSTSAISLVLCTRNRVSQLERTLESLRHLELPQRWELVIVDNGSSDGTPDLLRGLSDDPTRSLRVVHEPTPGLGTARNSGWRASSGSIIAFTDDDCYPASDYLARVEQCFAERADLGFVGGRILLHDPSDARVTIQEHSEPVEFPPRRLVPAGWIQGAAFACRRQALEDIGGFDARFGAGTPFACEDIDAVARISAAGWVGSYDPRPVVAHHHGRKPGPEIDRLHHTYSVGRGAYFAKSLRDPVLRRSTLRAWLSAIRYQPLSVTFTEARGAIDFIAGRR